VTLMIVGMVISSKAPLVRPRDPRIAGLPILC